MNPNPHDGNRPLPFSHHQGYKPKQHIKTNKPRQDVDKNQLLDSLKVDTVPNTIEFYLVN